MTKTCLVFPEEIAKTFNIHARVVNWSGSQLCDWLLRSVCHLQNGPSPIWHGCHMQKINEINIGTQKQSDLLITRNQRKFSKLEAERNKNSDSIIKVLYVIWFCANKLFLLQRSTNYSLTSIFVIWTAIFSSIFYIFEECRILDIKLNDTNNQMYIQFVKRKIFLKGDWFFATKILKCRLSNFDFN